MQGRIYKQKIPMNANCPNQNRKRKEVSMRVSDGYDIKCLQYIERQQYKHAIHILSQPFYYVSSFLHKGESVTMFKRPCH